MNKVDLELAWPRRTPNEGLTRRSLVLGASAALSGCALSSVAVDGAPQAPGRGYLALQVASNQLANLAFNSYGKTTFASSLEDGFGGKGAVQFVAGERTLVLDVPVGDYMWTRLWTGLRQASMEASRFQIAPQAVTYVGRLELRLSTYDFSLRVGDHEAQMRDYLREHYPKAAELPFSKQLGLLKVKAA